MSAIVQSILPIGSAGIIVEIECHLSSSLPAIVLVGLGNRAVDEARERVRSAFASSGITIPKKRITINLAPADTPKESTSFDLAIALAILQSGELTGRHLGSDYAVIGELGLGGNIRPVRGIIGKIRTGMALGVSAFVIPADNLDQAQLIPEVSLIPIRTLRELWQGLQADSELEAVRTASQPPQRQTHRISDPFAGIVGQDVAKRALRIAAAGRHNVLLNGPPGTGKTMLASRMPYLMPPMSHDEMLDVTHIHSLTGARYEQLIDQRPFRTPHHSASQAALAGGGSPPRPGEISLAHNGVLFLDEMPEFGRQALESLRQPLEERTITIARSKETVTFPADFVLLATANPCPCGYLGTARACTCTAAAIQRYHQKLSGPLLDRIDIHVTVSNVDHTLLLTKRVSKDSDTDIMTSTITALHRQHARFKNAHMRNSMIPSEQAATMCRLQPSAASLLNTAAANLDLSARSYMRVLRVARTIADLDDNNEVCEAHIAESLSYRPMDWKANI